MSGRLRMMGYMDNPNSYENAQGWQQDKQCTPSTAELFFPDTGESSKFAKEICRKCTVSEACLAYALSTSEKFGIWGGLDSAERKKLQRKSVRRLGAVAAWHS